MLKYFDKSFSSVFFSQPNGAGFAGVKRNISFSEENLNVRKKIYTNNEKSLFSDQASGIFAQIKRPGPTQILEGFVYFYKIYQIFDKSSDIYLALTMMLEGGPD